MSDANRQLMQKASQARDLAYAPYSGFTVGAALLTDEGDIFTGCNIENSSYGLTICAERVAIFTAAAQGKLRFRALAVSAETDMPVTPCGACLQVLSEFSPDGNVEILVGSGNQVRESYKLSDLLSKPFNKNLLKTEKK